MLLDTGSFCQQAQFIATGVGFVKEKEIPLTVCVATGASDAALSGNVLLITLDDNDESITVPFKVPLDYDESADELAVTLTAELTTGDNDTNAITIDLDQVEYARPGDAATVDKTADTTSDAQGIAVTVEEYTFDLSGLGWKAGDCLSIEIDAQETGTAIAVVYAAAIRYRSDLVAFEHEFRSDVDKAVTND